LKNLKEFKKVLGLILAAAMLLSLAACDNKTDPPTEKSPSEETNEDECICEICDLCEMSRDSICGRTDCRELLCQCDVLPDYSVDNKFTFDSHEEWDNHYNSSNGVFSLNRKSDVKANMIAFSVDVDEAAGIVGSSGYASVSLETTFEEFLEKSDKTQKEFAEDFAKSGMSSRCEIVSVTETELDNKYTIRTEIDPTVENDEQDGDGLNVIYMVFDEFSVHLLVFNYVGDSDYSSNYLEEFEEMVKTFRVII